MRSDLEKAEKTRSVSHENGFDAALSAARRRSIDAAMISSDSKTFLAEFADASFLGPFVGTHRIQRVPKGETKRHTSTITVAVLGTLNSKHRRESPAGYHPTCPIRAELDETELHERFTRGTGNGGQHKNKTDSCVVLTHVPSGVQVRIDGRSQWNNRQEARAELARRLVDQSDRTVQLQLNAERVDQIGTSDRAEKAFTYNEQRDEVVEHASGQKWRLKAFMKGRF